MKSFIINGIDLRIPIKTLTEAKSLEDYVSVCNGFVSREYGGVQRIWALPRCTMRNGKNDDASMEARAYDVDKEARAKEYNDEASTEARAYDVENYYGDNASMEARAYDVNKEARADSYNDEASMEARVYDVDEEISVCNSKNKASTEARAKDVDKEEAVIEASNEEVCKDNVNGLKEERSQSKIETKNVEISNGIGNSNGFSKMQTDDLNLISIATVQLVDLKYRLSGFIDSGADDSPCSPKIFEVLRRYAVKAVEPLYAMSIAQDKLYRLDEKAIVPIIGYTFNPVTKKREKIRKRITLWKADFLKEDNVIFGRDVMKVLGLAVFHIDKLQEILHNGNGYREMNCEILKRAQAQCNGESGLFIAEDIANQKENVVRKNEKNLWRLSSMFGELNHGNESMLNNWNKSALNDVKALPIERDSSDLQIDIIYDEVHINDMSKAEEEGDAYKKRADNEQRCSVDHTLNEMANGNGYQVH